MEELIKDREGEKTIIKLFENAVRGNKLEIVEAMLETGHPSFTLGNFIEAYMIGYKKTNASKALLADIIVARGGKMAQRLTRGVPGESDSGLHCDETDIKEAFERKARLSSYPDLEGLDFFNSGSSPQA